MFIRSFLYILIFIIYIIKRIKYIVRIRRYHFVIAILKIIKNPFGVIVGDLSHKNTFLYMTYL